MPLYLRHINEDSVIYADNTPKPKMSNRKGSTWDYTKFKLNGEKKKLYLDTTWGKCGYFNCDGTWYRISLICAKRKDLPVNDYVISINDEIDFEIISRSTFLKEKDNRQPGPYHDPEIEEVKEELLNNISSTFGMLRKLMTPKEITAANQLVKEGRLEKGKSDDKQQSIIYRFKKI